MSLSALIRAFSLCLLFIAPVIGAQENRLDNILKNGELRVGISLFEPWAIQDDKGKLRGFEIDVANKVAEDMGVKVNYKVVPWSDIIGTLEKGQVDVIISGMAITPQRALKISFSTAYADSGIGLATHTKTTSHI